MDKPVSKEETTRWDAVDIRKRLWDLMDENTQLKESLAIMEELRGRLGRLSERQMMVNRISREFGTLDMGKVAEVAVTLLPQLINAKYCSLFLYDEQAGELVRASDNRPEPLIGRVAVRRRTDTVMSIAFRRKEVVHIVDIDEYERKEGIKLDRTFAGKYATKSCISAPLVVGESVVGILNFADKLDGSFFNEIDDLPVVEQIRHLLAVSLQNCRLFGIVQEQARSDALTGLANQRALRERLRHEIQRAARYRRPLSMLMIDIDHFKKINDTFGHQAGDFVLAESGRILASFIRREDFPARPGGDEIAIVLPETPLIGAVTLGGRIVALVRGHPFLFDGKRLEVSVSMGIAELEGWMESEDFLRAADGALYEAKRSGRDRFAVSVRRRGDDPFAIKEKS